MTPENPKPKAELAPSPPRLEKGNDHKTQAHKLTNITSTPLHIQYVLPSPAPAGLGSFGIRTVVPVYVELEAKVGVPCRRAPSSIAMVGRRVCGGAGPGLYAEELRVEAPLKAHLSEHSEHFVCYAWCVHLKERRGQEGS